MDSEKIRGAVEMSAAMLISGTIGWFVVMSGQPVTAVVFWRCAFGAVSLLAVCAARGLLHRGMLTPRQLLVAIGGGAAIVINWLLLFAAYPLASISVATAVYNTQPFMLLALGACLFGEKITLAKIAWLLLAFAGVIAIVAGKADGTATGQAYSIGILLALAAAFFYALTAIAVKWLKGTPPHVIALVQVLTGTAMLAPFAVFTSPPQTIGAWSLLATVGIVHTGLMYVLLYGAIQKLPTHMAGALSFLYPVAAIAVDRLAFGHALQPAQILGAVTILAAAAGITLQWRVPRWLVARARRAMQRPA